MGDSNNATDKANFQSTYGILCFGVPSQGMDVSSLVSMAEGQVNLPFLLTLGKESQLLRDLHRKFCASFNFRDSVIVSYCHECQFQALGKHMWIGLLEDENSKLQNEGGAGGVQAIYT
jgi:hypothetical protein